MKLLDWLDNRTGYYHLLHETLYEAIPGGARWRYVWGSTLVFTFSVQVITGLFLWMAYSASAQTAWESVYYIQHQMVGGWLLRGVHHFTAHAMVVLLVLHLMQVVIDGAYRVPREVNFWTGLVLMLIVLGLSLTGYLLPWDQKGYWATRVATNLMGLVPGVGGKLQQIVVGGSDYGHHTLTRFFALHAGVLPALLVMGLVFHVYLFRRQGICARRPDKRPSCTFWPDQVLKDAVACLAVLAVVLLLVIWPALDGGLKLDIPRGKLGAELGAPADPADQYAAARPEWYFLFLFQMLKYFPGKSEAIGALLVPGAVMLLLAAMPFVGRWRLGHRFNVCFVLLLIFAGVVPLTLRAWYDDRNGPQAEQFKIAVAEAADDAERAAELASRGIPPAGAITLVRHDAKIQGRKLFKARCAMCHGAEPNPKDAAGEGATPPDAAPRLDGFASRAWLQGLLDAKRIAGPDYFGRTAHAQGDMVRFVTDDLPEWKAKEIEDVVIALSAEAQLPAQSGFDREDQQRIEAGRKLIADEERCAQCHKFHDAGALGSAPDLTGYGSGPWIREFLADPAAERFYGKHNDRMPAFAHIAGDARYNLLTREAIGQLADWLRGDWNAAHAGAAHAAEPEPEH